MSRPERTSHDQPHSQHVSEQHLLGPDVEKARYDLGAQVLATVDGEGGQIVVDALADIAPALAHHVVAYAFGDVYARPASPMHNASSSLSACSPLSTAANPSSKSTSTPHST
jgi:hypothetical protein